MELQIEGRNVDMTPAWKTEIEDRVSKLHTGHDDLIHGRVTLTKNLHHHKAQDGAEALIVVSLSGRPHAHGQESRDNLRGSHPSCIRSLAG